MSGLALIHNWFPDPYLTGTKTKPELENATVEYWTSPFMMVNVKALKDGFSAATWTITGLPADKGLTACVRYDASGHTGAFRPLIVTKSDFVSIASSAEITGVSGISTVPFTVPSDGIIKLRLSAPNKAGEDTAYSRVMITETATFDQINALIVGNMVFGYNLMPAPRR